MATKKTVKKVAPHNLTADEIKTLTYVFRATWDAIAGDVLDASGGEMSQEEVIDVVLDADYAQTYGVRRPSDKETLAKFNALEYEQQTAVAKEIFNYKRYGR